MMKEPKKPAKDEPANPNRQTKQKFKLMKVAREYDKLADAAAVRGSQERSELASRLRARNSA